MSPVTFKFPSPGVRGAGFCPFGTVASATSLLCSLVVLSLWWCWDWGQALGKCARLVPATAGVAGLPCLTRENLFIVVPCQDIGFVVSPASLSVELSCVCLWGETSRWAACSPDSGVLGIQTPVLTLVWKALWPLSRPSPQSETCLRRAHSEVSRLSSLTPSEGFKQLELRPLSYERGTVEIEFFLERLWV